MMKERRKLWYKHQVIIHNKSAWYNSLLKIYHGSPCTLIHFCHACTNVSMWMCICYALGVSVRLAHMRVFALAHARTCVHVCVWVYVGVRYWECVHKYPCIGAHARVFVPVCASARVHVPEYARASMCARVYVPKCAFASLRARVCVRLCTSVRLQVNVHECAFASLCARVCVCVCEYVKSVR